MKVEALVFDLYGTLLDVRSLDRLGAAEAAGRESLCFQTAARTCWTARCGPRTSTTCLRT